MPLPSLGTKTYHFGLHVAQTGITNPEIWKRALVCFSMSLLTQVYGLYVFNWKSSCCYFHAKGYLSDLSIQNEDHKVWLHCVRSTKLEKEKPLESSSDGEKVTPLRSQGLPVDLVQIIWTLRNTRQLNCVLYSVTMRLTFSSCGVLTLLLRIEAVKPRMRGSGRSVGNVLKHLMISAKGWFFSAWWHSSNTNKFT